MFSVNQIIVYVIIHILTYILVVHVLAKGHNKTKDNQQIKQRFGPFLRNDIDNWGIIKCFPFYITFWPRVIATVAFVSTYCIFLLILMIGVDKHNPQNISPLRKRIIKAGTFVIVRCSAFSAGLAWVNVEYVSTGEGDYKKWLGPDWKP